MPHFIAVQCFKCNQYQVSQKRKDSKFNCKLCNAKQSVRKVIAHSDSAADVRKLVQQLNLTRGRAEEQFDQGNAHKETEEEPNEKGSCESSTEFRDVAPERASLAQSRWQPYSAAITKSVSMPDPNEGEDFDEENDVVTVMPDMRGKGCGKKRKRASRQRNRLEENTSQRLRNGISPTRRVISMNYASLPCETKHQNQRGATSARGVPPVINASLHEVHRSPPQRPYDWGSGMSQMNQLPQRSNSRSHSSKNRWGAHPPQRPQTPPRSNIQPPSNATAALDSDGLLTALGADEVVQDEVLY